MRSIDPMVWVTSGQTAGGPFVARTLNARGGVYAGRSLGSSTATRSRRPGAAVLHSLIDGGEELMSEPIVLTLVPQSRVFQLA